MQYFKSHIHLLISLPDEKSCREFLEKAKWAGEPVCPHCLTQSEGDIYRHYKLTTYGEFNGLYKCRKCGKRFTVTVGTMFEGSHVPLKKWFYAIWVFTSHKKGISSVQLAKDIAVTQKTAWFMLARIRHNFEDLIHIEFGYDYQVDETFVGGKPRKREKMEIQEPAPKKEKSIVMGILSARGVYTKVIPNREAETLEIVIKEKIDKNSTIISDGWKGYSGLSKDYTHIVVNHSEGQYVNYGYTTNHLEGFWSHLKRGILGIYHLVSPKHLSKYCNEFAFRYNSRNIPDGTRFAQFLASAYKRLRYEDLIFA